MLWLLGLLWSAQNERIYEHNMQHPIKLIRRLHAYSTTYFSNIPWFHSNLSCKHYGETNMPNSSIFTNILISWSPLPYGSIRYNFDIAVKDNSASIAYVIRDNNAKLIYADRRPIQPSSVNYAEIMAAWLGFSDEVSLLNAKNIFLEGDFAFVIKLIVSLCKHTNRFHHPILHDIRYWIQNCEMFCANHAYKEANKAVHFVARCTLHDKCCWLNQDVILNDLLYILQADKS